MNTYKKQAALLKLMAHPMRLQILDLLCCGDECVCHLSASLDKPQPYVSQQLAILRNAGVVEDYKEGANVFYRITKEASAGTRAQVAAVLIGLNAGQDRTAAGRTVVAGCPCPKCSAGS